MRAVGSVGAFKVSSRGQMSLPADTRRRWGIEDGGTVEVVDTGSILVIVPGGRGAARALLYEAIEEAGGYAALVREVVADEPDLA
jgi:AbrB family looped-hinge helix DNA binding protein